VQFRFVYGSDGSSRLTDGIAFDNVWIGERDKIVLIEHFTNASDDVSKVANETLNSMTADNEANMINIQYHTNFPGNDPFYEHDPVTPGTRVFYYSIGHVPYSILDGGSTGSHRFDYDTYPPDETTVILQSLLDGKFNITTDASIAGNDIVVNVEVIARQDILLSESTLHLAVIEREINSISGENGETVFRNVIKTLMPNAGGTSLIKSWNKNEVYSVNYSWTMQNILDPTQLQIVAFIQNEENKEILQSSLSGVYLKTGLKETPDLFDKLPGFIAYPNPSSTQLRISFSEPLSDDISISLFSNNGLLVFNKNAFRFEKNCIIPVNTLPAGIYILQLTRKGIPAGSVKINVSH